ncbi:MAG: YicC/YloC family endoribonuclease, partial [Oscillospiraceae bacterium]
MIKSMTGYGRAQMIVNGMNITVEIKSVNHRYFEFSAKSPRTYGFLDDKLKTFCNSVISRGKIECYVGIDNLEELETEIFVNHSLAGGYLKALKEISEKYDIKDDVSATVLSRYPDVITLHKAAEDEDKIWQSVKTVCEKAVENFVKMREVEGEKLKTDINNRAAFILECVEFVEKRSPQTVAEYNEKLKLRMAELLADVHIEEQRLLVEAAIFADKIAVDEETVRLRSHINEFENAIKTDKPVAKKLDFII